MTSELRSSIAAWKRCNICVDTIFKTAQEFRLHLRQKHCKKEGGSYVCCYGKNNICGSLPLEGVNDQDYEFHVVKHHVLTFTVDDDNYSQEENFVENLRQKYAHIFATNHSNPQPNVVDDTCQWTVYHSSQNLPAVLNDPRKVKREYDLFTKTWSDSFVDSANLPPTYLPEISYLNFESYLRHLRKGVRRNARKVPRENTDFKHQLTGHGSKVADIEEIPSLFLQTDFNLENPAVFNAVIPLIQLYESPGNPNEKNSVKLLQEKMSHYLDIVEVRIAYQISLQSEAFFHAMTSHDALMDQLTDVIKCVCELRDKIHIIEDVLVTGPMKIMRLKRRQKNLYDLHKKLNLIATIHQTQPGIQKLLNHSDFVGALDMIYTTQEVLAQELSGIHSFRHLSSQLSEMEKVIGKMMITDFTRYVTADLNRPHTECLLMEEEKLIAIVFGMLRQNQFRFVQTFKEECFTTLEATIKQIMIEVVSQADSDVESNTGNISEQIRSFPFSKWIEVLNLIMKNLHFLLQRIQALYQVMDDTLEVAAGFVSNVVTEENFQRCRTLHLMGSDNEIIISEQDYLQMKPNLKEVVCSICDHAHECCAKILSSKAKDGSLDRISVSEFFILAKSIENFQQQSEVISGKQSTALRLSLQNQATKFVSRFHEEKKNQLSLILGHEQWKQADVPMEFQDLVNNIISSGCISSMKKRIVNRQKKPQFYLVVNGENFAVCGAVLMLLKMVIEYCECAEELPILARDLANRLVELLKSFNSRTCQLILGAGALQIVGLKTITTKHLALTSRCLHLIVCFIPYVKNHFHTKTMVDPEILDKYFDQVTKIYMDHVREINLKMESIICTMFESQLKKWEAKAPVPSPAFNAISNQLKKVHDLIHDVLSPEEVRVVFRRANGLFKCKLRDHLARLQVNNDGGPQHGLVTQELTFYVQNLKKLKIPCDFDVNDLWTAR